MERVNASPPQRKVFRKEIRSAIRDAIFEGELRPGDKIIETFWARELGVSQGPVREAIRDLEAQGLVETVPFKGSRVRTLTERTSGTITASASAWSPRAFGTQSGSCPMRLWAH